MKFLDIPYDTMDCVDLTFLIQKSVFDRNYEIEPRERGNIFYFTSFLKRHLTEFLDGKTDSPKDGDCVLLKHRGRLCHVGTLHIHKGKKYIVHTMDSFFYSCIHEFDKIGKYGFLEVEGIYSWK